MPSILVRLEVPHLDELSRRFRGLSRSGYTYEAERGFNPLSPVASPQDEIYVDPSRSADLFVHRCIGTATELEDHQQHGGGVLLAYPDGSMRAIGIDLARDGMSLSERPLEPPPWLQTDYRRRRRGRRFSL